MKWSTMDIYERIFYVLGWTVLIAFIISTIGIVINALS